MPKQPGFGSAHGSPVSACVSCCTVAIGSITGAIGGCAATIPSMKNPWLASRISE